MAKSVFAREKIDRPVLPLVPSMFARRVLQTTARRAYATTVMVRAEAAASTSSDCVVNFCTPHEVKPGLLLTWLKSPSATVPPSARPLVPLPRRRGHEAFAIRRQASSSCPLPLTVPRPLSPSPYSLTLSPSSTFAAHLRRQGRRPAHHPRCGRRVRCDRWYQPHHL